MQTKMKSVASVFLFFFPPVSLRSVTLRTCAYVCVCVHVCVLVLRAPVCALCVGMRSGSSTTGHWDNQSLDCRSGSCTVGTIHLNPTAAGKRGGGVGGGGWRR